MEMDRTGIPLLTQHNYNRWRFEMEAILDSRDCLSIVKGIEKIPVAGKRGKTEEDIRTWQRLDATARSLISRALDDEHHTYVRGSTTSAEMWIAIRGVREKKSETDKLLANQAFHSYKWEEGNNITSFISGLKVLRENLEALDMKVDETMVIGKILQSLPPSFDSFKMSWRLLCSDKATVASLQAQLLSAEIDMKGREGDGGTSGDAFFLNRNRFQGKKGNRSHQNKHQGNKSRDTNPSSTDKECWYCQRKGHLKSECRKRAKDQANQGNKDLPKTGGGFTGGAFSVFPEGKEDTWFGDSGAYAHITRHKEWFTHLEPIKPEGVCVGDDNVLQATMKGTINIEVFDGKKWNSSTLNDVRYVPDFGNNNLLSFGALTGKGYELFFKDDMVQVKSGKGTVLVGRKDGNVYPMAIRVKKENKSHPAHLSRKEEEEEALKWHLRLGHISKEKMKLMITNNLVSGLKLSSVHDFVCEGCTLGRMSRKPYSSPSSRETVPGAYIHSDVCGPFSEKSVGGSLYFITFKDEATAFRAVYFMKNKSDALQCFKQFLTDVSCHTKWNVKKLRTDNGREYVNQGFREFLLEKGIIHEKTPAYSPALNGIAERENRTLVEMARAMIISKNLPLRLWAEAVHCAAYVMNRVPNRKEITTTPFESWFERKPDVSHFRIFGSTAFVHIPSQLRRKLDPTSRRAIFVGYGPSDKLFRVYDPHKRNIETVRDIKFQETLPPKLVFLDEKWKAEREVTPVENDDDSFFSFKETEEDINQDKSETSWPNEEEANGESNSGDVQEAPVEPAAPPLSSLEVTPSTAVKKKPGRPAGAKNKPKTTPAPLTIRLRNQATEGNAMSALLEPLSVEEALSSDDCHEWTRAMQEEIDALDKNETWTLVDSVLKGRKTVKSKWVFKVKTKPDGSLDRYKARLVAKGYTQREGIDYTETFAPVVRYESVRTLIAISALEDLEMCQFDIKTAFLYGHLKEDIYMNQPEGYEDGSGRVCKLQKGLYGLKQSPRCWNDKFHSFLSSYGLIRSEADHSVYQSQSSSEKIILGLYVDDGLLCCSSKRTMERMLQEMSNNFEVKVGDPSCFVGLELKRDRDKRRIEVCQKGYIKRVLEKYNMSNCTSAVTPGDSGLKLSKSMSPSTAEEKEEMKNVPYRQAIGSLNFISVCTRPDISYELSRCAQFCENPGQQHWTRVKRILRYLQGSKERKLVYELPSSSIPTFEPIGYSDSDWAGCPDSRRSTTGFIFTLAGAPVTWSSKQQKTVALSSTEAEYMSASDSAKDAKWIRQLLHDLGYECLTPTPIMVDNQGAIHLSKNPGHHQRTKHIDIKYHFIRQEHENGVIELKYLPTQEQPADMMTKTLVGSKLESCCRRLNLVDTVYE